ncbi:MAG: response regulator [Deltaproteobacteria bacterium]|nr:response regulator [Deltaproteobacteria bacterium]
MADSYRVLYIEDDENNFFLVRRTLEVLTNVEIVHAATALEGLKLAKECSPDVILMDIQLPGMDGLELTRKMKKEETLKDIPVLALTANVMKGERERAFDAGCVEFVAKPFSLRQFRKLVAKHLGLDLP